MVIAGGSFFSFVRSLKHARAIADTPTSRIRSAAQGFLELEGQGQLLDGDQVRSPLTASPCLWWQYQIEEKRSSYSNGRRSTKWVTIDSGRSAAIFELEDETGRCVVDPDGAKIIHSTKRSWYGNSAWPRSGPKGGLWSLFGRYRYTETLLLPNIPLYAIGFFRTERTAAGHFDEKEELSALLSEWKRDQATLLARFDLNKDGKLDLKEWEAVRRVALARLRREQVEENIAPGLHVLAKPVDGRPFIISSIPQQQLLRRHRWSAAGAVLVFLPTFVFSVWLLLARGLL